VPAHEETLLGTRIAQQIHRKLRKSARMSRRLARLVRENQSVYNKQLQEGGMKKLRLALLAVLLPIFSVGCMSAAQHRQDVRDDTADRLTVGKVQREIRVGMTSAQVVEVLGSPNMVTTDEKRREVWVYDKVATEHAYSTSSGGVLALILLGYAGGGGAGGGGILPSFSREAGASSSTQRTLTIVIKFDEGNKVRDFAYRQSSF
jgi:outer membrane protein assembly factor BamE (lipoprotein component of BamABCDE complex)